MSERLDKLMSEFNDLRNRIEQLEQVIENEKVKQEANRVPSIEDRWKPSIQLEDWYCFIGTNGSVSSGVWTNYELDIDCYNSYNCWKTKERAEEVAKKVKLLFLMEQIHDILCPDYKPDWNDDEEIKYSIFFDFSFDKWQFDYYCFENRLFAHFDTKEHAEQACKILNDMGVKP